MELLSKISAADLAAPNGKLGDQVLAGLKSLFDRRAQTLAETEFDELCVEGFDEEQIWAIIHTENERLIKKLDRNVKKLSKEPVTLLEIPSSESDQDQEDDEEASELSDQVEDHEDEDEEEQEEEEEEEGEMEASEEDEEEEDEELSEDEIGPTEVDDEYFKLSDMEKFADFAEEQDMAMKEFEEGEGDEDEEDEDEEEYDDDDGMRDEEDDVYSDRDSNDEGRTYKFQDFWGDDTEKKQRKLTSHEKRQLKIKEQIQQLEEEALAEKPWELRGETQARVRPKNSLLERGDLDVEYLKQPAPTITEETTETLQDLIRQRIFDNDFDDVERRLPMSLDADTAAFMKKQDAVLSMEKSDRGLGEEYEKEYREKVMNQTPEEESKLKEEHEEIQQLFTKLCYKLDALSNYHYTPKPPSLDQTSNKPIHVASIEMEEAMPVAMSTSSQAAPEHVLAPNRKGGVGKSAEELDQSERKRQRQAKKTAKRAEKRRRQTETRIISKLQPGMGNKHSKQAALNRTTDHNDKGKDWTKSSTFFQHLQDMQQQPATTTTTSSSKQSKKSATNSAAAFKL